jgi:hypothetical protein
MVVQLGFESVCATRRADSFDCISIRARPIDVVLPDHREGEEKYNPTKEQLLKQIQEKDAVLVVFQAKRVIYNEEVNEAGELVKKQEFVGEKATLFRPVNGVVKREGPISSQRRYNDLWRKIISLVRQP